MAQQDKTRWDAKHTLKQMPTDPLPLVTEYASYAPGREALDIACGNGRHSLYLSKEGFQVEALDISSVAIASLQGIEGVTAKEVDLDTYQLPRSRYDLIIDTYFLDRRLFPQIIEALTPNGIVILQTFLHHPDNERTSTNPTFRLYPGELEETFGQQCALLYLREYWDYDYQGKRVKKVGMVAKK